MESVRDRRTSWKLGYSSQIKKQFQARWLATTSTTTSSQARRAPVWRIDWNARSIVIFAFCLQFILWGAVALDNVGIYVPIVRPLCGFVYLTVLPGVLILRISRIRNLDTTRALLYGAGLSIATLTIAGLLMNFILPRLGVANPLSLMPLLIVIGGIVSIAAFLVYFRDRNLTSVSSFSISSAALPQLSLLALILFLSVFGTYVANYYQTGAVLMFMIAIIAAVAILVGFDQIQSEHFPLFIYVISASLLYHMALISPNMMAWGDSATEYWTASSVTLSGFWNVAIPHTDVFSPSTALTILMPIYSFTLNVGLTTIFKLVFPLLYSLVPVCIYLIVKTQTKNNDKIAFFSSLIFISYFGFFTIMLGQSRLMIAELFFMLILFLWVDKRVNRAKSQYFVLLFAFCLIFSHYTLGYILATLFVCAWLLFSLKQGRLMLRESAQRYASQSKADAGNNPPDSSQAMRPRRIARSNLTVAFIALFVILTLFWALAVANSSIYAIGIDAVSRAVSGLQTDFLNSKSIQGLGEAVAPRNTPAAIVLKILNYCVQGFIIIGVLATLVRRDRFRFTTEYLALSVGFLLLLLTTMFVPFMPFGVGADRLYGISLLLLSPFCVIGAIAVFCYLGCSLKKTGLLQDLSYNQTTSMHAISVFFAIYLLFATGVIAQLASEPTSVALSPAFVASRPHFNDQEVASADWLASVKVDSLNTHADFFNAHLTLMSSGQFYPLLVYDTDNVQHLFYRDPLNGTLFNVSEKGYFFFGTENIKNGTIEVTPTGLSSRASFSTIPIQGSQLNATLATRSMVYNSGGAYIYYSG